MINLLCQGQGMKTKTTFIWKWFLLWKESKSEIVERAKRFELSTSTLARWHSTTELYPHIWCLGAESNHRHEDFQSSALPTELPRQNWRRRWGSNPRPPAWQAGVLTNWTTAPGKWWTMTGSNCRHPACKAGALPAELIVHIVIIAWWLKGDGVTYYITKRSVCQALFLVFWKLFVFCNTATIFLPSWLLRAINDCLIILQHFAAFVKHFFKNNCKILQLFSIAGPKAALKRLKRLRDRKSVV